MSEYQYYEFQAIDRPLSEAEMRELRARSSRATITPTRFANFYNWGDLNARPSEWMAKYFDAFLYLANWGSRRLMFRLPAHLLELETAERYCRGEFASARTAGDFVLLDFHSEDEYGGDWEEDGSGWLSALVPLRADVAAGDYRALYLAWLLCVWQGDLDEDETEPPIPPGLKKLSASLQAFADFLRIDEDLLAAAAEHSPDAGEEAPKEQLARWIATLSGAEKDRMLVSVATGEDVHLRAKLLRGFREARGTSSAPTPAPRTVAELLAAAERRTEARLRREAEKAAREKARREKEEAEARERRLDKLAKREAEEWGRVDELVAMKQAKAYDQAVGLLRDLRDLARRDGRELEAELRITGLMGQHAQKRTFVERLRKAGL